MSGLTRSESEFDPSIYTNRPIHSTKQVLHIAELRPHSWYVTWLVGGKTWHLTYLVQVLDSQWFLGADFYCATKKLLEYVTTVSDYALVLRQIKILNGGKYYEPPTDRKSLADRGIVPYSEVKNIWNSSNWMEPVNVANGPKVTILGPVSATYLIVGGSLKNLEKSEKSLA